MRSFYLVTILPLDIKGHVTAAMAIIMAAALPHNLAMDAGQNTEEENINISIRYLITVV